MKTVKGKELSTQDKTTVLGEYTRGQVSPLFRSPEEWLENTTFLVRNDGRLDTRYRKTTSYPGRSSKPEFLKVAI